MRSSPSLMFVLRPARDVRRQMLVMEGVISFLYIITFRVIQLIIISRPPPNNLTFLPTLMKRSGQNKVQNDLSLSLALSIEDSSSRYEHNLLYFY